ncbi:MULTISPECIES: hypothetical protein [Paraburkholderia]|uniref:Uncharacterized protein n=1 Tax=Paraburkholderia madseniana TaxID=2599607 RepID=A0AAP5BLG7_9BURK|nr:MULTISPECIES: hypothetical protein [Paraburkholderia]MCX4152010.1 hypothetical protein [Paraburkholderia madseniana]MCX4176922.1 hypothetical protein [Paraburkholderia madseniana]MDN7154938.1 hypothetical protein [Paraburkholderia sp. WS6]MDQ6413821.1 hypothetical protein [Paraburkholderia madseniana]MDQ6464913.1 hypothetical protein [Paraburkholderia madseniana]
MVATIFFSWQYTFVNNALDERYSRPLPDRDVLALTEVDVPPEEIEVRRRMEKVGYFMGIKEGFSFVDRLLGGSGEYQLNERRLDSALGDLRAIAGSTPAHKAALRRVVAAVQESGKTPWPPLVEPAREA